MPVYAFYLKIAIYRIKNSAKSLYIPNYEQGTESNIFHALFVSNFISNFIDIFTFCKCKKGHKYVLNFSNFIVTNQELLKDIKFHGFTLR